MGKKTEAEENGISNRQLSTTFIPPLTAVGRTGQGRDIVGLACPKNA
jgi:hypothetical protein